MRNSRLTLLALAVVTLALAAPAAAQPGCDTYDSGLPRPASDPSPDVACGGPGPAAPPGPQIGTGSLTTIFAANNSFVGNTFDIVPNVDMTITSFDVNLDPTGTPTTMAIYWRPGTANGFESTSAGWTLLGTDTVNPQGLNVPTPVNIGGLALTAGQTYGFYVDVQSYPSSSLQYTNGGPTTFSNADMDLTTFHGKGNPAFTGSSFFPRQWNGTVYYDLGGGTSDLTLVKDASDATVPPGGGISYSLTVSNLGPDPADNVIVTDNLPIEFSWVSDDCGAGPPAGGPPNGTLTWMVGNLPVNASATCNVSGTVDGPPGTVVVNDASAVSDSEDPTPATSAATVVIQLSVLEIPTLSKLGLGLLLLLLAGAAVALMRRSA